VPAYDPLNIKHIEGCPAIALQYQLGYYTQLISILIMVTYDIGERQISIILLIRI